MSAKEISLRTKVWYWKRASRNKINKTSSSFKEKGLGVDVRYLENEIARKNGKKIKWKNLNFYINGKYNEWRYSNGVWGSSFNGLKFIKRWEMWSTCPWEAGKS